MTIPVYIFDPAPVEARRNWESLQTDVVPKPLNLDLDEQPLLRSDGDPDTLPTDGVFVCLIHYTRLNKADKTVRQWGETYTKARFIAISGSGVSPSSATPANVLRYQERVFDDLTEGGFRPRFVQWYGKWSRNIALQWDDLTFDKTPLYALRLLCEAWKLSGGYKKQAVYGGVRVAVPLGREDWFAPFDVTTPEPDDASRIGEQMGDASNEAKALLTAVVGDRPLGELIENFLEHR